MFRFRRLGSDARDVRSATDAPRWLGMRHDTPRCFSCLAVWHHLRSEQPRRHNAPRCVCHDVSRYVMLCHGASRRVPASPAVGAALQGEGDRGGGRGGGGGGGGAPISPQQPRVASAPTTMVGTTPDGDDESKSLSRHAMTHHETS